MACRSAVSSTRPRGAGRFSEATTRSPSSSTESFRLLEPAFTTRIRTALVGPGPGPDVRVVLALQAGVRAAPDTLVGHVLAEERRARPQRGDPVDHVHHQV